MELDDFLKDVDFDHITDEELDELLDIKTVKQIAFELLKEEMQPSVLNPVQVRNIQQANDLLQQVINNSGVKIKCGQDPLFRSYGDIRISGKEIVINDPAKFLDACELSSVISIFADLNEEIHLDLSFPGLTIKI